MNKRNKIIYWISTGLLTILISMSAGMYFLAHEMVSKIFILLGFPTYIIYPLAVAKILGLIAIWSKNYNTLKEWAYAGFLFNFILALSAHLHKNDGEFATALLAIIFLSTSYIFYKRVNKSNL